MHFRNIRDAVSNRPQGRSPQSRAIVLQKGSISATVGFPALQVAAPKRVFFERPIPSSCRDADGKQIAACFVLAIWQSGARLRLSNACPENFYLWFTAPPGWVVRKCRRVGAYGSEIDVVYERFVPNGNIDLFKARGP